MWIFLLSEILLFGGMFILYSAYRYKNPGEFHLASMELDVILGTLNTLILLTSSLTMALSIAPIQRDRETIHLPILSPRSSWAAVSGEQIRRVERQGRTWDLSQLSEPSGRQRGDSFLWSLLRHDRVARPPCIGGGWSPLGHVSFVVKGRIQSGFILLENSGLYWHLVDIIWIFLFPFFI